MASLVNAPLPNHAAPVDVSVDDYTPAQAVLLVIGTAGIIAIDTLGGDTNQLVYAPVGVYPVPITKLYNTGTAASNISAVWFK